MSNVAFVCVGNAGRSQMAAALAERERERRGLEDAVDVVTMGCSVGEFAPEGWDGTAERWDLDHPGGEDLGTVRDQRDEIRRRVEDFFDRIEAAGA